MDELAALERRIEALARSAASAATIAESSRDAGARAVWETEARHLESSLAGERRRWRAAGGKLRVLQGRQQTGPEGPV